MVAVERRAALVVDDALRVELWLASGLAFLESGDTAFRGLDGASNPFLNEIRRQLRLISELFVERVLGLLFRGDTVLVRVSLRPFRGRVRTVEKLIVRLMEVVAPPAGHVEFDFDGPNHIPHLYLTL